MIGKPLLELDRRVRVLQSSEFLGAGQCGGAVLPVARHSVVHEHPVEPDAGVVDVLVQGVGVPLGFGHRETGEPVVDGQLHLDVAPVVGDELLPPVRVGCGWIAHPALVEHAGLGRGTELTDEFLTCTVFSYRKVKGGGDLLQAHRQAEVRAPDHGAVPLGRIEKPAARHELWMLSGEPA